MSEIFSQESETVRKPN